MPLGCTHFQGPMQFEALVRESRRLVHCHRQRAGSIIVLVREEVCNDYNGFWDLTWLLSGGGSKDSQLFRQQCCKVIYTSK